MNVQGVKWFWLRHCFIFLEPTHKKIDTCTTCTYLHNLFNTFIAIVKITVHGTYISNVQRSGYDELETCYNTDTHINNNGQRNYEHCRI
jgi:hypothetical protein